MASPFGFDLSALEVFTTAVETGNLTSEAERLGTTQSSVSQTLANLESSLEVRLLDRSVRPLRVTTAGRFLYDRASHILAEARRTGRDIQAGHFQQLHHVRIALVDSIATAVGRPLIDAVRRRTEDWSTSTGLSHMHAPALLSRQVDIIISDDALEDHVPICFYNIQYNKSLSFSSNFPYIVNIIELLIIFQISSLYFHAFIGKLAVKEWTDGTACFYWLTNETFGLPNSIISFIKPVLHNRFIILILTWGTLLIELVLALGFLFKQEIKNYIFVIGVVFHFLIWIFHGLGNFMLAMDAALILYLLPKNIKIPIYVYR